MSTENNSGGVKKRITFGNNKGGPLEHTLPFYKTLSPKNIYKNPVQVNKEKAIQTPVKQETTISSFVQPMFKNISAFSTEDRFNIENIKNEYKPYITLINTVRHKIINPKHKLLYIYEFLMPFDIKNKLQNLKGLSKIQELEKIDVNLYNYLINVNKLLTDTSQTDYNVFVEFILNYTGIPNKKVFGGRRKSHTRSSRNRRHNQSKTKRNLRK